MVGPGRGKPERFKWPFHLTWQLYRFVMITKTFAEHPGGIVVEVIDKGHVKLQQIALVLSDEGKEFWDQAEGVIGTYFGDVLHTRGILPSQIDNFVAVINKDKTAQVYINESKFVMRVQSVVPVKAGQGVRKDDIGDVEELRIDGVEIPKSSGLVIYATFGWRRMLFWDFSPLSNDGPERAYELEKILAQGYSRCLFNEHFKGDAEIVRSINETGWFPFVDLGVDLRKRLLNTPSSTFDRAQFTAEASTRLLEKLDHKMESWSKGGVFEGHFDFLRQSVTSYREGNYLVSISVFLPRLEAILKKVHGGEAWKIPQSKWVDGVTRGKHSDPSRFSILFPHVFKQYVQSFVYKNFDGDAYMREGAQPELGRHSAMHGVAKSSDYNLENATKLLLVASQIHYLTTDLTPTK